MNENIDLNWQSIIKIEKEKNISDDFLIYGISFNLDEDLIFLFEEKELYLSNINLSAQILQEWRNYLLNHSLIEGIKFTSYYPLNNKIKPILQTRIHFQEQIFTSIDENILNNAHIFKKISLIHYWLINQFILVGKDKKI